MVEEIRGMVFKVDSVNSGVVCFRRFSGFFEFRIDI